LTSIHTPVVPWCWVGLWIPSHSRLCINGPSEPSRLTSGCVCQWVNLYWTLDFKDAFHIRPLSNCFMDECILFIK